MRIIHLFFNILFVLLIISCSKQNKKKTVQKEMIIDIQKKELKSIEKKTKRPWDSLNTNNVNTFFSQYEKLNKETKVVIKTSYGDIKLRLYNDTPIHRANFIFLTKIKYFDNTVFYRVTKNFVIQGGKSDDEYIMRQRTKYGNYSLKPEFLKHRKHKYGALAAARDWENNPNKLSSPFEFYIVQNKKGAHHLNNEHTVFGEIISGYSVMNKIAKVEVGSDDWPKVDIKMKVEILD